jgi:hypothetical protein
LNVLGVECNPRVTTGELNDIFPQVVAIAVDGPRGTGKTITAKQRAAEVLDMDSQPVFDSVEVDPARILQLSRPLTVDEWLRSLPLDRFDVVTL